MSISALKCEACHSGAPQVSDEELKDLIKEIPDWNPIVIDNVMQLEKEFKFKNFRQAIAFTNKIGDMAEEQGHHPSLLTEWGKVTIRWWTHSIHGLHKNDFICAAKCDQLV